MYEAETARDINYDMHIILANKYLKEHNILQARNEFQYALNQVYKDDQGITLEVMLCETRAGILYCELQLNGQCERTETELSNLYKLVKNHQKNIDLFLRKDPPCEKERIYSLLQRATNLVDSIEKLVMPIAICLN